ncbi:MAG: hypothetical protein CM15mP55_2350 [Hyphomicrobiales bacterium]|nr:MAG: hypothetical protein CM15mP55_2350 [Hyphomicrobiales bacterium]
MDGQNSYRPGPMKRGVSVIMVAALSPKHLMPLILDLEAAYKAAQATAGG